MKYRTCGRQGLCILGSQPCALLGTYFAHLYFSAATLLFA